MRRGTSQQYRNLVTHHCPATMPTSPWLVAAPFIASAVLLVIGPFIGKKIEARLSAVYTTWRDTDLQEAPAGTQLASYAPATVAKSALWAMDAAQILGAFLLPVLGVIVLTPSTAAEIFYVVYCAIVLIALVVFVRCYPIDDYHTRRRVKAFTLVPLIGIPVNIVAAILAYTIAS